jgi:phage gpG-like protein
MSMTINISGADALLKNLKKYPEQINKAVKTTILRASLEVQTKAQEYAPRLTGDLSRSIAVKIEDGGMTGRIGTNKVYARIQEYGGVIVPKRAKFLAFKVNGKWVRAKKVRIPQYKGRGYLTPAGAYVSSRVQKMLNEEISYALK